MIAKSRGCCFGLHYSSNATCPVQASLVVFVFCHIKDYHIMSLQYLSVVKNICVRQVASDKWFHLTVGGCLGFCPRKRVREPQVRKLCSVKAC